MHSKTAIEERKKGTLRIIVTDIPYQQTRDPVIKKIAEGPTRAGSRAFGVRDESDLKEPVRIVIDLKKDADPDVVLNQLYKFTPLQDSILDHLARAREWQAADAVAQGDAAGVRAASGERYPAPDAVLAARARRRKHIVQGLLLAHANIDEVIRVIRRRRRRPRRRKSLIKIQTPAALMKGRVRRRGSRAVLQEERGVDLSADFRLFDAAVYAEWYGHEHRAQALQETAVYGLTEHNRAAIARARLVANPGCYPTGTLLALLPLVAGGLVDRDAIVVDAKSGVSGAGRALEEDMLFCEVSEAIHAYGIGRHRHMPEMEQELSRAAGRPITISFTPHLIPMNRGELMTIYVRLAGGATVECLAGGARRGL